MRHRWLIALFLATLLSAGQVSAAPAFSLLTRSVLAATTMAVPVPHVAAGPGFLMNWLMGPLVTFPPLPGVDWNVRIVDSNGTPVSIGGGTQYADGTVQATATGTAVLWNDVGTLRVASAAKPLPVSVTGGGGSATSATDEAAWTAGASLFNPLGGVFNDTAAALTTGQQGTQRFTPNRAGHVNLRTNAGVEIPFPAALVGGRFDVNIGATAVTQPISAASLPLPTGAAADSSLTTISSKLPAALVGGRLDVNLGQVPGVVSTVNSSTATLAGNAVFTGTSEDVSAYASIEVSVFSDQASAAAGFSAQWSPDGTNWDQTFTVTISASVGQAFALQPRAKFFRMVYTNGAAGQSVFRLQTIYHAVAVHPGNGSTSQTVQGAVPNASTVVGTNPLTLGVTDASNLNRFLLSSSAQTDAEAGINAFSTGGLAFNGTTYDRVRSAAGAQATTGTGLLGTGPLHVAVAHGANPATVTAGQFAYPPANRAGVPFVIGGHPNVITFSQNYTTAQTDTQVIAGVGGSKIVVTAFMITVANSTSVDVSARLGFGATVVPAYGNAGILGSHPGIAAGGGFAKGTGAGIIGVGADGESVRFTASVPTGGSVDCEVTYYTTPS